MSSSFQLQVKKLNPEARLPERKHQYDAGYDLYSCSAGVVPARSKAIIETGIAIQMPKVLQHSVLRHPATLDEVSSTLVGIIKSRSGLSAKFNIEHGAGVIDFSYTGPLNVILYNHSDEDFVYDKHTRVAQLVILPVAIPSIVEVNDFDSISDRGDNGFGSTGLN